MNEGDLRDVDVSRRKEEEKKKGIVAKVGRGARA